MFPREVFYRVPLKLDVQKAGSCLEEVEKQFSLGETLRQLCVTSRRNSTDPYLEGSGTAKYPEEDFTEINEAFRGTEIERFVLQAPFRLGRVRLMVIPPRVCYSYHHDAQPRLHLALRTNEAAYLMVEETPHRAWTIHVPANGCVYWVNTTKRHTAMNMGEAARIHLVGTIVG